MHYYMMIFQGVVSHMFISYIYIYIYIYVYICFLCNTYIYDASYHNDTYTSRYMFCVCMDMQIYMTLHRIQTHHVTCFVSVWMCRYIWRWAADHGIDNGYSYYCEFNYNICIYTYIYIYIYIADTIVLCNQMLIYSTEEFGRGRLLLLLGLLHYYYYYYYYQYYQY